MKIFISSVMSGFEDFRDAAIDAIQSLDGTPVRAEDFGALPSAPQEACLRGVRESDIVIVIIGARYGARQRSGFSATHEEFNAARGAKPILAFVQSGVTREKDQAQFLAEVQDWSDGLFTAEFSTANDLRRSITRAVHQLRLAEARQPALDEPGLHRSAEGLIVGAPRTNGAMLAVAAAAGPHRQLIPTADFDSDALVGNVFDIAVACDVFTKLGGAKPSRTREGGLVVSQGDCSLTVTQSGGVLVAQPATTSERELGGLGALVEEEVEAMLARSLRFVSTFLQSIDPTNASDHVALVIGLVGAAYTPWRTRAEFQRRGGSGEIGHASDNLRVTPPQLVMTRQHLSHRRDEIARELMARLRREVRP